MRGATVVSAVRAQNRQREGRKLVSGEELASVEEIANLGSRCGAKNKLWRAGYISAWLEPVLRLEQLPSRQRRQLVQAHRHQEQDYDKVQQAPASQRASRMGAHESGTIFLRSDHEL
jgi:hypothetical protein